MSKNKIKIALIMFSAFFCIASCSALAYVYVCTICNACWDKEFMKMSINSAAERSEDLNVILKFMCVLGTKKKFPLLFFVVLFFVDQSSPHPCSAEGCL